MKYKSALFRYIQMLIVKQRKIYHDNEALMRGGVTSEKDNANPIGFASFYRCVCHSYAISM
jgi:hypothetical protein